MTPRVITVETDASIMEAVRLMLQNRISGLLVLGRKGELVGGRLVAPRIRAV
jgi:CBS domain-containing protein